MGIVEANKEDIIDNYGESGFSLLKIYEDVYPPDLSITLGEEPGMFDFDIYGGDIGVAGFYVNPTYPRIVHLATQDLLFRINTDRGSSRLFPSAGNTNIAKLPKEALEGNIAIAVSESPYIDVLNSIRVTELGSDKIRLDISAETVTGDSVHVGFLI